MFWGKEPQKVCEDVSLRDACNVHTCSQMKRRRKHGPFSRVLTPFWLSGAVCYCISVSRAQLQRARARVVLQAWGFEARVRWKKSGQQQGVGWCDLGVCQKRKCCWQLDACCCC